MKQKLQKILAFSLALTVLVSSHSFAWFEHLCTITKIKSVSFNLESCAGDLADATATGAAHLEKGNCCEVTLKVNKADDAIQQNFVFLSSPAEPAELPEFRFEPDAMVLARKIPVFRSGDLPPPLIPIYLLNQQFII